MRRRAARYPFRSSSRANSISEFLPLWVRRSLQVITGITMFLVITPTAYLVVWGFYGTEVVGRLRNGSEPTISWFTRLLGDSDWLHSLAYSTVVAAGAALVGTVTVVVTSYFLRFRPAWIESLTLGAASLVLLTPAVTYAMAMRWVGVLAGLPEAIILFLGHIALILPLQYLVFDAGGEAISSEMLFAGRTLGASHLRNFLAVFLPNSVKPLSGAFIVGFFVSFDEVVIAVFVLERAVVTVPLRLWQQLSHRATPDPAVVAILMIIMFLILTTIARFVANSIPSPKRRRFRK